MKVLGTLLEMGANVDTHLDPADGDVLVVVVVKVEDARELAPMLGKPVSIDVEEREPG